MREIKFRAWDGETFYYVNLNETEVLIERYPGYFRKALEIEDKQFYTGVKDKTGKDCYEKDYDEDGNMIDYCQRCFGYQFFQIDIPTKDVIFCHNCEGNFMIQDHIPDFEVIGNVYEGDAQRTGR